MNTTTTWHDFPRRGEASSCCGRTRVQMPLAAAMTSDQKRVTCDGKFAPTVMAHEAHTGPSENPRDKQSLADALRHHAAVALALMPTESDLDNPQYVPRLQLAIEARTVAWHVAALREGLSGQEALDWVHEHASMEDNEVLFDLCQRVGVELHRIRSYELPKVDV